MADLILDAICDLRADMRARFDRVDAQFDAIDERVRTTEQDLVVLKAEAAAVQRLGDRRIGAIASLVAVAVSAILAALSRLVLGR